MEAINDISEWFESSLQSILATQKDDDLEQWIKQREKEKENGLLDEFVNWATGESHDTDNQALSEQRAGNEVEQWIKQREKEKENGLLDEFINWATGKNSGEDMDRYRGR